MDTALPEKFPFILDRNLAKANCTENHVCTSCDTVVLALCFIPPCTLFVRILLCCLVFYNSMFSRNPLLFVVPVSFPPLRWIYPRPSPLQNCNPPSLFPLPPLPPPMASPIATTAPQRVARICPLLLGWPGSPVREWPSLLAVTCCTRKR